MKKLTKTLIIISLLANAYFFYQTLFWQADAVLVESILRERGRLMLDAESWWPISKVDTNYDIKVFDWRLFLN